MGLFGDLAKAGGALADAAKKAAQSDEAKKFASALGDVAGDMKEGLGKGVNAATSAAQNWRENGAAGAGAAPRAAASQQAYHQDAYAANAASATQTPTITVQSKIRNLMMAEFPEYELRENVSPTTIGGTGRFMNYTFGVYLNGQPKLFMMVIGKTTCSHREYRWSKEQAQAAGVPMINWVEHYPNKIDYMVNRLHQYL